MSRTWLVALIAVACAPPPPVGLNEIGPTWAEIHNQTERTESIGEWTLQFELRTPWTIQAGTEIAAGGLRVVDGIDVHAAGTLKLSGTDGERIQEVDVPELAEGQSYARLPDGTGRWEIVESPTRGESNPAK